MYTLAQTAVASKLAHYGEIVEDEFLSKEIRTSICKTKQRVKLQGTHWRTKNVARTVELN